MYPRFFPMLFGKKNLNFLRHISPSRDQFSWCLDVGGGEGNGVTNFDPRTRTIFYGKRSVASVSIPYPHADIEIYLCQTLHQLRELKQKKTKQAHLFPLSVERWRKLRSRTAHKKNYGKITSADGSKKKLDLSSSDEGDGCQMISRNC